MEIEEPVCDCGQPLEGGEDGLCKDCIYTARNEAADLMNKRVA